METIKGEKNQKGNDAHKKTLRLNLDVTEMALKDHMTWAQKLPVQLCNKEIYLPTNLDSPKFLCWQQAAAKEITCWV